MEPSERAASALKRVYSTATFSSLTELSENKKMVDVILMSHNLEHFYIPCGDDLLAQIGQVMTPETGLIIEVPHVDMRKHSEIRLFDTPHFMFFSKESLRLLFESKGWDVLYCETCSSMYQDFSIQKNYGLSRIFNHIKNKYEN